MMGNMPRWRLGTLGGHRLFLEPIFLLLVGFFVFSGVKSSAQLVNNLVWIPVLFVGILWHEIGHALAIDRYGYGKSEIVLQGMGGVTVNQRRGHARPGESIVISVAGPLFSLSLTLVFGAAAYFYPGRDWFSHLFLMMAWANGVWAVFNMMPIFPLDGGNVMLHAFRKVYGSMSKAYLHTAYVSLGVMVVVLLGAVSSGFLSMMWAVLLGLMFGMQNVRIIQQLQGA